MIALWRAADADALPASRPGSWSVSHTRGMALLAVASDGRPVGVDVEAVRSVPPGARRALTAAEAAAVGSDPSAFFACWTRKEAVVKARRGLLLQVERVEVDPHTASPFRVDELWVVPLDVGPGFAAAVAHAGDPAEIVWRR